MALTQVTGPYPIFTDLDGTPLDDGYLYIGDVNQDPEQNPVQVYWDSALTIAATQPIRTSNGYAYRNGTPALIYTAGAFSITIRNKREEFVLYSPVGYGFDPAAVSGAVVQNDFTGDGTTVNFTLSAAPSTKLATSVFINGVYQEKSTYSVTGNVLTFTVAPPLSSGIEVMTNETGVIGSTNATLVSYTAGFAGAVAQTVQTKLEQYISVKDFGAVGNGVANDTAAINAAYTAAEALGGAEVCWPAGDYVITGTITCGPLSSTNASGGATLTYTGSGTAFVVQGVNTSETYGQFHVLPYINRSALDWNSGTDTTSIGLNLKDRKYNTFVVAGVKRFNTGIALQADVANFVCNTIQLGVIQNNRLGIDFSRITGLFGINQNTFIAGAIVIDSAYTSAANRIYLNMTNAGENNTNTFVGVNLEKSGNEKAIVCASSENLFLNCRFEGSAATAGYVTISGNNNRFVGGAPASSGTVPFVTWIADTGVGTTWQVGNVVSNKYMVWDTHSSSKTLRFGDGSAYPAYPIGAFGATSLLIGDSATSGMRYKTYSLQDEVITTSGTTIPPVQHQQLNYAAPVTITNITGGFDQTVAGVLSLISLNGNVTLQHTAAPASGFGQFVLKAGVNLAMSANTPVLFVARDGNLYQV